MYRGMSGSSNPRAFLWSHEPVSGLRAGCQLLPTARGGSETHSAMGEHDIGSALVIIFRIDRPGCARRRKTGEGGVDDEGIGGVRETGEDVDGKEERRKGQERENELSHLRWRGQHDVLMYKVNECRGTNSHPTYNSTKDLSVMTIKVTI